MNQINNITNLSYLGESTISLSKAVLLLYLLIANNYTTKLFSHQMQDFLDNSRFAQHVVGLLTLLVIINLVGVSDPMMLGIYTVIGYLWFIFTTKVDLFWNLLIIGAMIIALLYENMMVDKEIKSESDQALESEDKQKIKEKHTKKKTFVVLSIIILTAIGVFGYYNKKTIQYGGNFDEMKFIFG